MNNTKVLRGGSWYINIGYLRCSCRHDGCLNFHYNYVGFRLVGKERNRQAVPLSDRAEVKTARGGCWSNTSWIVRSAKRFIGCSIWRIKSCGFRFAASELKAETTPIPMAISTRSLRGGSWFDVAFTCLRCSSRLNIQPAIRDDDVGLRLVGEERKGKYDE